MGALHDGHLTLIREAAALRSRRGISAPVIASIFVNPTQFNDPADLDRYPRTLDRDLEGCRLAGADAVFVPSVGVIYPHGGAAPVPALPRVATAPGLEDAIRPGHFSGVCQVVARLFDLVRPRAALFGEKDWQQFCVIRAMARASAHAAERVEVIPVPTVRDADGIAMSSRNVFLSGAERQAARAIPLALATARSMLTPSGAESVMRRTLRDAGLDIQYAVVRHADTLEPLTDAEVRHPAPTRVLIAVKLPSVRLIDNTAWHAP